MILCRRIPIFDIDVYLINTLEDAKAFVAKHTDEDGSDLDQCRGVCHMVRDTTGKELRMLCVFDGNVNTVVHESTHMAWMILKYVSIKISQSNDEPIAFMTAYLAEEMLRFLDEQKGEAA